MDTYEDHLFIVTSDPAALGPHTQTLVKNAPLSTSFDDTKVHPALISLSVNEGDFSHTVPVPNFVLPVGRLLRIDRAALHSVLEPLTRSSGMWLMMIIILDPPPQEWSRLTEMLFDPDQGSSWLTEILSDLDQEMSLLTKTISDQDEWELETRSTETRSTLDQQRIRNIYSCMKIGREFLNKILSRRMAGLNHYELKRGPFMEQYRREFWQAVLQVPEFFRDTNYVLVVDAVEPSHAFWLIHRRVQMDHAGEEKIVEADEDDSLIPGFICKFDAAHILTDANYWFNFDSRSDPDALTAMIQQNMNRGMKARGLVTVHPADIEQFHAALQSSKKR